MAGIRARIADIGMWRIGLAHISNISASQSQDRASRARFNANGTTISKLHSTRSAVGITPKIKLEKFSTSASLGEELQNLEKQHVQPGFLKQHNLQQVRGHLLLTIENAQWSRYVLGKALDDYRTFFKSERGWMEAAAVISRALCCNGRTVRNIISDYESLKALPEDVIDVAYRTGIDLAKKRYVPAVKALEASIASDVALDAAATEKIIKEAMRKPKVPDDIDSPFIPLTSEEQRRWAIRLKIRTALNNIPTNQKLMELLAALEEEMQAVWGQRAPVTVTITPRKSPLTIDGKKRKL